MKITGNIKTKEGRKLPFEFKTIDLGKVLGKCTTWSDTTFHIKSELTIDGNTIGTEYYNFTETDLFKKHMYHDARVYIDKLIFSESEIEDFGDEITSYISYCDEDQQEWFWTQFVDRVNSKEIGEEYIYLVDELAGSYDYFHDLLKSAFEFSNGYHCLSQWNEWFDYVYSCIDEDFVEYQFGLDETA